MYPRRRNDHWPCRRYWLDCQKSSQRKLHSRSQCKYHKLRQVHSCHGWQHRTKKYLEDQKILPLIGGAVLNAATFIGGNYLAKSLSGDSGQAALDEKIRHDKALEKYQADYAQYQKDRTALLDWIAKQDRVKNKAIHEFQDTDQALTLYNQTHRTKVALPKEPEFSDYYKPSEQQKNGELLFIGASTLALGYAAFRFL